MCQCFAPAFELDDLTVSNISTGADFVFPRNRDAVCSRLNTGSTIVRSNGQLVTAKRGLMPMLIEFLSCALERDVPKIEYVRDYVDNRRMAARHRAMTLKGKKRQRFRGVHLIELI